jgi:hypothetical protein
MVLDLGLDPDRQLKSVWRHGRIAICQTTRQSEIPYAISVITAFLAQARAGRPQLVYVDEGLDFFHPNALARGGDDAILRTARAGRERGVALLFASQRPKGIPLQVMSEMTKLYGFALDFAEDTKRLQDMSYPARDYPLPEDNKIFRFWDKSHRKDPPILAKLQL